MQRGLISGTGIENAFQWNLKVNWIKVDRAVCSAVKENIHAIVRWGY